MAQIKKGILNAFTGKIGNFNGYGYYNRYYIRSIPTFRTDYGTQLQSDNREIFKSIAKFQNQIYYQLTQFLLARSPGVATPYFKFNKLNYSLFNADGLEYYQNLRISLGNLLPINDFRITAIASNNFVRVEWINDADGIYGFDSDLLYCFAYNVTTRSIQTTAVHLSRDQELFELQTGVGWTSRNLIVVYGAFARDGYSSTSITSMASRS